MNKFNNIFLMGLICFLIPIITFIIVMFFSGSSQRDKYESKKESIVYDTVKVKVKIYDTVRIEKIKYVKKVKSENDSTKNFGGNN